MPNCIAETLPQTQSIIHSFTPSNTASCTSNTLIYSLLTQSSTYPQLTQTIIRLLKKRGSLPSWNLKKKHYGPAAVCYRMFLISLLGDFIIGNFRLLYPQENFLTKSYFRDNHNHKAYQYQQLNLWRISRKQMIHHAFLSDSITHPTVA